MRKVYLGLALLATIAVACAPASSTEPGAGTTTFTSTGTPVDPCAVENLNLFTPGTLTVGTDNPSFPPWIINNKPENGKGYEGALAYEIAERMGFEPSQVSWVVVPFNSSYAPGAKEFDFDINNIAITEERDQAVDFSDGYYELPQGLMVLKGSPLQDATTQAELKDGVYGAQIGSTSLQFINTVLQPTTPAAVYDTTNDAKAALRNGDVDGLVLDLPTAYYEANFNTPNGYLVGQFAPVEELGLLFEEGNPLVTCVNEALAEIEADGTLQALQDEWLADYQAVPVIE
jgi:polar amino acid transport system substrate-binding protein